MPSPHGERSAAAPAGGAKKQTARMIKCTCATCGYVARTSRMWIVEVGAPHCPRHGAMTTDGRERDERQTDLEDFVRRGA
ncbi:hypothetical protein [Brevundimonas sp.]|uniref:hypothetical protein n=1 Tax=Brevundimonas sp. TaxID=1871086 RepID=UPI002D659370|nr:hypothetical protein [Brevundimonas sp.]HYD29212.1 hypothetical protein [Brevundimonas sp.]